MLSYTITLPSSYDHARPHLQLFALYASVAATLLLVAPQTLLELPLLEPIERFTGLPHLSAPTTLPEKQIFAMGGAFGGAIAMIYTIQAGPAWKTTGRLFAEGSILTRLGFASIIWWLCLCTPYGNSFVLLMSAVDATSALLTKYILGVSFKQLLTGRRPDVKTD